MGSLPEIDHGVVADILDGAADYLEQHGRCRDQAHDSEGRLCLLAAVSQSRSALHATPIQLRASLSALRARIGIPGLVAWQDNEASDQQVLDLLRRTAKHERILAEPERGS
jgi:hypothetical protein